MPIVIRLEIFEDQPMQHATPINRLWEVELGNDTWDELTPKGREMIAEIVKGKTIELLAEEKSPPKDEP